jgi:hypothetical protein
MPTLSSHVHGIDREGIYPRFVNLTLDSDIYARQSQPGLRFKAR